MATLFFNRSLQKFAESDKSMENFYVTKMFRATFDGRAFNLPIHEVVNNLIWRQQDTIRNSTNSLAQSLYSQKELSGISSADLRNKMINEKEVDWDSFPAKIRLGSCCVKDENENWKLDENIPLFTQDRNYVERLVNLNGTS